VLTDIRETNVDCVVVGGDVLPGPMPRESLGSLLDLDIPMQFIRGNGEVAVLQQLAGKDPVKVPEQYRLPIRWTAQQLRPREEQALTSWPMTLTLDIPGLGSVLFCHATPQNPDDIFTKVTPEERLLPAFEAVSESVVVCGHTHMQFDRMIGRTRVVNAGSVGMPFGQPGGDWLLLGPDIQLRHTNYDLDAAAARIRLTGYPEAAEFAERYVLRPPSEAAMLEAFSAFRVQSG